MKRLLFAIAVCLQVSTLWAAQMGPWSGETISPETDASGAYVIQTAENLAWVAKQSAGTDFAGKIFRLEADLDLGGAEAVPEKWQPIGSAAYPFRGEFDGNNHVISNLYINGSFPTCAGLFSETGAEATIHNLGLAQGKIVTDKTDNVGAIVGINRGQIHHCFSMVQIALAGNNIGGLVGVNEGEINYSYNTGIITDAKEFVGGLAGWNKSTARLNECYNSGYCRGTDHVGALFGKNEAPADNLTKVYFDQQMTRMHVTGYGSADPLLDNSKFAIATTVAFSSDKSPFTPLSDWTIEENLYPRLVCFGDHVAALLSTSAIGLDSEKLPTERAEGVGAPDESKKPRKEFKLFSQPDATWISSNDDNIHIANATKAEVKRPCGNQEVILEVSNSTFTKQIYTIVKGYETFDPGKIDGGKGVCLDEAIKFSALNNGEEKKEPTGGKDDEQNDATLSYQYMIIRDTVISNQDYSKTYITLDTVYWNHGEYSRTSLPTDVPGNYSFRRYTKDAQCHTEWAESPGRVYLTVREGFDAGSLVEKPDTIYANLNLPQTLTIESEKDASGGDGKFTYLWRLERREWNPETGTWDEVEDNIWYPLYISGSSSPVNTASFDYTFTKPGQYSFTRQVKDESCNPQPSEAYRPHIVVVYEELNPGSVESFERELCTPDCTDTIHEIDPATGGDGLYSYRWLCNGKEIANSDTMAFLLERYQQMTTGDTYVFTRQVKDNTGKSGWMTSEGSVTIHIYRDYDPGAINTVNEQICYESGQALEVSVAIGSRQSASGDIGAEFHYCWLLYKEQEGKDPVFVDTIRQDEAALNMTLKLSDYRLSVPVTISIQRAVKNMQCASAWKISANKATWRLGRSEKKTQNVTVCYGNLPYTYTYTYTSGREERVTFTEDGQAKIINDLTPQGCSKEVTLQCRVTPAPEVEVKPVISVCESASTLKIEYTILSGLPDRYDLTFPASMQDLGFEDVIGAELSDKMIEAPLPADVPYGKYQFTIMFYVASAGSDCKGIQQTQNFTFDVDGYVNRKGNDIVFVDNSGKHTEAALTFDHYQWYRNNEPIEGETGQYYYEYNGLNGVYSVDMITADGTVYRSCQYEMRPMTPLDNVSSDGTLGRKVLREGQLFIVVGEKMYNMLGQEVQQ